MAEQTLDHSGPSQPNPDLPRKRRGRPGGSMLVPTTSGSLLVVPVKGRRTQWPAGTSTDAATTPPSSSKRPSEGREGTKSLAVMKNPTAMVKLSVGDFEIQVHKDFAVHYSPVLKAAFDSNFLEGQTGHYKFHDISSNTLSLLVNWLYTQRLELPDSEVKDEALVDGTSQDVDTMRQRNHREFIELWVTADMLLIPRLQNAVTSAIIEIVHRDKHSGTKNLKYIWDSTAPGSPLRDLSLDIIAGHLNTTAYNKNSENFPHEMLIELAERFAGLMTEKQRESLQPNSRYRGQSRKYFVPEA